MSWSRSRGIQAASLWTVSTSAMSRSLPRTLIDSLNHRGLGKWWSPKLDRDMSSMMLIHPIRWSKTRPFSRRAIEEAQKLPGGMVTMSFTQSMLQWIMPTYNDAIARLPFEKRPTTSEVMRAELNLALVSSRFFTLGRNIFKLSPGLSQALQNTNLDDVRVKDIRLPHRFFYISLAGIDCGGLPGSDNLIDGVYVDATMPGSLQLYISSRRLDANPSSSRRWPLNRDPYFYVPWKVPEGENPTFIELLDQAISSGEIKVAQGLIEPDDLHDDDEIRGEDGEALEWVVNVTRRNSMTMAIDNREALPNVQKALSIAVNALAWLTAEPDETIAVWPDEAPADEVKRALSGKPGERKRAGQALRRSGFTSIRILGPGIPLLENEAGTSGGNGSEIRRSHWRIGHYRRQAYGPGKSERKLIWIRPVLVRADLEVDPDEGGHVYNLG